MLCLEWLSVAVGKTADAFESNVLGTESALSGLLGPLKSSLGAAASLNAGWQVVFQPAQLLLTLPSEGCAHHEAVRQLGSACYTCYFNDLI